MVAAGGEDKSRRRGYRPPADEDRSEVSAGGNPRKGGASFLPRAIPSNKLTDHVVLVGHGRVGSFIAAALPAGTSVLVIEDDTERVAALKSEGKEAIAGNAAYPDVIGAANLRAARCLLVAIPDAFEGGQVTEQARALNPALRSSRVPIPTPRWST